MMKNRKSGLLPVSMLKNYTESLSFDRTKKVTLGDTFEVIFKVPTIREYIDSGEEWINGIADTLEESMTVPNSDDERNDFIADNARATALRQYGHYIDTIILGDNNEISGHSEIMDALDQFSSVDDIRTELLEKVSKFIDSTTISIIGIPSYVCPSCEKLNEPSESDNKDVHDPIRHILPLDLQEFFFQVLGIKIGRVKSR
jgi:hypothetical protein